MDLTRNFRQAGFSSLSSVSHSLCQIQKLTQQLSEYHILFEVKWIINMKMKHSSNIPYFQALTFQWEFTLMVQYSLKQILELCGGKYTTITNCWFFKYINYCNILLVEWTEIPTKILWNVGSPVNKLSLLCNHDNTGSNKTIRTNMFRGHSLQWPLSEHNLIQTKVYPKFFFATMFCLL